MGIQRAPALFERHDVMKLVKLAWVLGGVAAMGLGMGAEACSSSSGTGTGGDAGHGSSTGSGSGSHAGTGTGTGSKDGGTPSGDAGCHKAPPELHAETEAGVYCPFSDLADSGKAGTCAAGQHCCEPPTSGNSTCTAAATTCATGDTDWQCGAPADCVGNAAGGVCCGTGTINMQAPCGAGQAGYPDGGYPAYPYVSDFKGTTCAASCNGQMFNGEKLGIVICSQQSDCVTGTCTPIEPKGGGTGYCAGATPGSGTGTGTGTGTGAGSSTGSGSGTGGAAQVPCFDVTGSGITAACSFSSSNASGFSCTAGESAGHCPSSSAGSNLAGCCVTTDTASGTTTISAECYYTTVAATTAQATCTAADQSWVTVAP